MLKRIEMCYLEVNAASLYLNDIDFVSEMDQVFNLVALKVCHFVRSDI